MEELKTKLPKILVNQSALGSYGGAARIHMMVNDRSGNSLAAVAAAGLASSAATRRPM